MTLEQAGWAGTGPRWLTWVQATRYAGQLERTGRLWAAALLLAPDAALIEVRSRRRPYPLQVRIRTLAGAREALRRLRGEDDDNGTAAPAAAA